MNGYISIREVLDNILDHPLLKNVSFERAVNHAVHFIRIVGCPRIFREEVATVPIKDYRGCLPCDLESIIQVRLKGSRKGPRGVFRYTTDSFHMATQTPEAQAEPHHPHHRPPLHFEDLTYRVQGNVIFTSIREGEIEVAYTSFAVDEDGYPLIPDNSKFIRALELYIKKQAFTVLFDLQKLPQAIYQNVCQEYSWAVGQAQSELVKPSVDQMQALTNSLNTLIVRATEHSMGFINNGTQERIRDH